MRDLPLVRISEGIAPEDLRALCEDPYIAKVGHDHRPLKPIDHPAAVYLSAWVGDSFAGAFLAIRGKVDFELHALLQRWAMPWSRELGRLCLVWAFSHPINRVTALVIDGLDTARNYCLKLGFKCEGVKRGACMQNGVAKDVHMLGMLRSEFMGAA